MKRRLSGLWSKIGLRSLKGKMILSYLAVALLTVLVVSALIRLTSGRSLMSLVVQEQTAQLTEAVQTYYSANGTLDGFAASYFQAIPGQHPPFEPGDAIGEGPRDRYVRGLQGLVDVNYRAVLPTFGRDIGEVVPREMIRKPIAVEVNGVTVAWILQDDSFEFKLSPEEQMFLSRTSLAIGMAALAGVLAAVAMGFFLTSRILKPVRMLTSASQKLAQGELEQQVPVTSRDEIGQLTATFNQMSADLARADQQRKRMTADITHDLSTPLQIISGYIEMLEGGEVTLTPQRIEIIKTELGNLRRLVGDLTTLTQVEAGGLEISLQPVNPAALLKRVQRAYQPIAAHQGVELTVDVRGSVPDINVDEGRMEQVLKNLVENALRYTPQGGHIHLGASSGEGVQLWVADDGTGIEADDLPFIFDRFYKADVSRSGNGGKMGLGLAICKALVAAQGGSITAQSDGRGCGTRMIMTFAPAAEPRE